MLKTHRWASAFRPPVPQSCIGAFWYWTGPGINIFVYSGTGLTGHSDIPTFRHFKKRSTLHMHIYTAGSGKAYKYIHPAHCTSILLSVELDTSCTSILVLVERATPCTSILLAVEMATAGCGNEYTLHVHSAGCGNGYTMHVHTTGCGNGYTLHVHRQLLCYSCCMILKSHM
jgi:hypothetical protein